MSANASLKALRPLMLGDLPTEGNLYVVSAVTAEQQRKFRSS